MKNIFVSLALISSILLSSSVNAMDSDIKFNKLLLNTLKKNGSRAYEDSIGSKINALEQQKAEGKQLFLIIGRGNREVHPHPLPEQDNNAVLWVYTDVDRSKCKLDDLEKPVIWMDFDDINHVKVIPNGFFNEIIFDWSVLKYFSYLDEIIPELRRILASGGKLIIPSGDQHGMVSAFKVELIIDDHKYPLFAQHDLTNRADANKQITERQKNYLMSIFGEDNLDLIVADAYPASPEKIKNLSNYFEAHN
jgi:hypothetical protein